MHSSDPGTLDILNLENNFVKDVSLRVIGIQLMFKIEILFKLELLFYMN